MINQVYNMFFGEAFESDEQEAELIKDADPFLMETESIPNDIGTMSDIPLEDLPPQIETPQDLPDFSVSSENTGNAMIAEQPVKRKRGRPPKIPRTTPGAPSSSTPKATPKSTTKSRTPSVFFSKNSPLLLGDAEVDGDYETNSTKYKRKRTSSFALPSTPSSLPVTPSGSSAFTRRSQRGRHIDISKDLVLLFPDDSINVKLDIKDPFELEQCLAALAEDTTQDWSDHEEGGAGGHGHGHANGNSNNTNGNGLHRHFSVSSNPTPTTAAMNTLSSAATTVASVGSSSQLETMSIGSASEKSAVLPHQKEVVFVPPVRDVAFPHEYYSSQLANNTQMNHNTHTHSSTTSIAPNTSSTNTSRNTRRGRPSLHSDDSQVNNDDSSTSSSVQNSANSTAMIETLKRIIKKQKGYQNLHQGTIPNGQFYKTYEDVYLDYDCDSDDERFLVENAPQLAPAIPTVVYNAPITSTPFQHFTIGGSSLPAQQLPGVGQGNNTSSGSNIHLNHYLFEQCIVRLEKEYELLKQFLNYYQDFSQQQRVLQTNFIHAQKLYALTKEYTFQSHHATDDCSSNLNCSHTEEPSKEPKTKMESQKNKNSSLKQLLQEMLEVTRPTLSLPTLATGNALSVDQFHTPSTNALLQAKLAAASGKAMGGGSSSSDVEDLLPSFAITMPMAEANNKEEDAGNEDNNSGKLSCDNSILSKLFPWSHAFPILMDVLSTASTTQNTQTKKSGPGMNNNLLPTDNKKEMMKLCKAIYFQWLLKHPDSIKSKQVPTNGQGLATTTNVNTDKNTTANSLPTTSALNINTAAGNWQPSQSLLRAYHRYIMHLWQFPEEIVIAYQLPHPTATTVVTGYERLAAVRRDLDRTRLIIDRVRRREKLKKEMLKVNQEILDEELYMAISEVYYPATVAATTSSSAAALHTAVHVTAATMPIDVSPVPIVRKRGRPRRIDPNAPPAQPLLLTSPLVSFSTNHESCQMSFSPAASRFTPHPPVPVFSFSQVDMKDESGQVHVYDGEGEAGEEEVAFAAECSAKTMTSRCSHSHEESPPTPNQHVSSCLMDIGSPTMSVEYVTSPGGTTGLVKFIQGRDRFGKFLKKAPLGAVSGSSSTTGGEGSTPIDSSTPIGSSRKQFIGSPLPMSTNGCLLGGSAHPITASSVVSGTATASSSSSLQHPLVVMNGTTYRRKVLRKFLNTANLQHVQYTILEKDEFNKQLLDEHNSSNNNNNNNNHSNNNNNNSSNSSNSNTVTRQLPVHCPYDSDNEDNILTYSASNMLVEEEYEEDDSVGMAQPLQQQAQSRRSTRSTKQST